MLNLSSTSDKVSVALASGVATAIAASWVDRDTSGVITPGRLLLAPSTAVTVDPVPAPAASTVRNVKFISISPTGGTQTITVTVTDGTLTNRLLKVALAQDETLVFTDQGGWAVYSTNGEVKQLVTGPGRLLRTILLTSGTTWQAPADCKMVLIRMLGGGGGGAGAAFTASNASAGGGGGAGQYVEFLVPVTPGTTYTIAIGGGGAGGVAGANNGSAGTATTITIGGTTYTASPGSGGIAQAAGTTLGASLGGAGGSAGANGDILAPGQAGGPSFRFSGTAAISGAGGSSTPYGAGGQEVAAQGAGAAGTGKGAGGSGAIGLTATAAGGNGSGGMIMIEQYG